MQVLANDVLRVDAIMATEMSGLVVNAYTIRLKTPASLDGELVAEDLSIWLEAMYAAILASISDYVYFGTIRIVDITQELPVVLMSWPTLVNGSGSGGILPQGVAALIVARTGALKVRGRKYLPPFTENDIDTGNWTSGCMARLVALAALWTAASVEAENGTYEPGVYSRVLEVFHPFKEALIRAVPAYQRRRRPGRGD